MVGLDVPAILKYGCIGLGFLLAFMSFLLLKKEMGKRTKSKKAWIIIVFMMFSLFIMLIGIGSELIQSKKNLHVHLNSLDLSLDEISSVAEASLNTKDYFISSEYGIAFKQPGKNWTPVRVEKGLEGTLKLNESKPSSLEGLQASVKTNPLGNMLSNATMYYFENTESRTKIEVTNQSSNKLLDYYMNKLKVELADTTNKEGFDTTKPEKKKAYYESLNQRRRSAFGFDYLIGKEYFCLYVFPKSAEDESIKNISLPSFYYYFSILLGVNADKLVANEKQILLGAQVTMSNMNVGGKITNFHNTKWIMVTENENFFYLIEINYSPQLSPSTYLWDDLKDCLNSFVVINKN